MDDLLALDGPLLTLAIPVVVCLVLAAVLAFVIDRVGTRLLGDAEQASALARTTFAGIAAVGVLLGVGRLVGREETDAGLSSALAGMIAGLPGLVIAFILFIVALLVAGAVRAALLRTIGMLQPALGRIVAAVAYWAIVVLVGMIAVEQAGMDIGVVRQLLLLFVTGAVAAAAIAIGFGTRDVVARVAAGRHVESILHVGDRVDVDGINGTVVGIGHGSVRLETRLGPVEVPHSHFLEHPALVVPAPTPPPDTSPPNGASSAATVAQPAPPRVDR